MEKLSLLPLIGDYFGGNAVELAGLVTRPDSQARGVGTALIHEFVAQYTPDEMIAYTRNPALLCVLGNVGMVADVLTQTDPIVTAARIPHASIGTEGILYHIDRYMPHGLYGNIDPAESSYNGDVLKERCVGLENKNSALAVLVQLNGGEL